MLNKIGQTAPMQYPLFVPPVPFVPTITLQTYVTAYYFGDSPHNGAVSQYIWRNSADSGCANLPVRSLSQSTAKNSLITSILFDPSTNDPGGAMNVVGQDYMGNVSSTSPVFGSQVPSNAYQNFNMVVLVNLHLDGPGIVNIEAYYKDSIMIGIGGGATWQTKWTSLMGQRMSALNGYPLIPAGPSGGDGGQHGSTSVAVEFPFAGIYPMEIDYDYWYHSGRTLAVGYNGKVILPFQNGVF